MSQRKVIKFTCKLCRANIKELDSYLLIEYLYPTLSKGYQAKSLRELARDIEEFWHISISHESVRQHILHLAEKEFGKKDAEPANPLEVLKAINPEGRTEDEGYIDRWSRDNMETIKKAMERKRSD